MVGGPGMGPGLGLEDGDGAVVRVQIQIQNQVRVAVACLFPVGHFPFVVCCIKSRRCRSTSLFFHFSEFLYPVLVAEGVDYLPEQGNIDKIKGIYIYIFTMVLRSIIKVS